MNGAVLYFKLCKYGYLNNDRDDTLRRLVSLPIFPQALQHFKVGFKRFSELMFGSKFSLKLAQINVLNSTAHFVLPETCVRKMDALA